MDYPTLYRTTQIDGFSIFYREAGRRDAPAILLLHGLPSSSRMFERFSPGFPIVSIWSRPTTRVLDTATGPTRNNSLTRSITSRKSRTTSPKPVIVDAIKENHPAGAGPVVVRRRHKGAGYLGSRLRITHGPDWLALGTVDLGLRIGVVLRQRSDQAGRI
jgi:hypothetical protein